MSVGEVRARVLVASSSAAFRQELLEGLSPPPSFAEHATGGADALMKLDASVFRTLFLDCRLSDLDFQEVLHTIERRHPEVCVVRVDSRPDPSPEQSAVAEAAGLIVAGMALDSIPGVSDWRENGSGTSPDTAGNTDQDPVRARSSKSEQDRTEPLPGMIGRSARMAQMNRLCRLVAPRDTSVLIAGDSGTGKELVAPGASTNTAAAGRGHSWW
jgi:DNA-binding NtrC family response regulator